MLFRVLFPSWRFFEEFGSLPALSYRIKTKPSQDFGPWMSAIPSPKRPWHSLFLNPEGNLFLAFHSLLEQCTDDLEEFDGKELNSFTQTTSYLLVKNLTEHQIKNHHKETLSSETRYQFRLTASISRKIEEQNQDQYFASLEHSLA